MKKLFTIALLTTGTMAFAQREVDVTNGTNQIGVNSMFTVNGTPFVNEKYVKLVSGSPYYLDYFMDAILVSDKGAQFKDVQVKLNLHAGDVIYKPKGTTTEMTATTSIKEVILIGVDSTNYRFIHSSYLPSTKANPLDKGWYLWLASGKATLYKYYTKLMSESTPYGQATVERSIRTREKYVIAYNDTYFEVKKLKDIPDILANKKNELESFLKTKDDKNASMDDRFASIIEYYNSLFAAQQ